MALCQVCTVLKLMIFDSSAVFTSSSSSPSDSETSDNDDESEHDASDDDDEFTVDLDSARHPPLRKEKRRGKGNKLHISRLLQMVLQDAQTWLFFKVQAMIQSEVRYYVPRLEDLRWPELLMGMPTN